MQGRTLIVDDGDNVASFNGEKDVATRWRSQFSVLIWKNSLVLLRRRCLLLAVVVIPAILVSSLRTTPSQTTATGESSVTPTPPLSPETVSSITLDHFQPGQPPPQIVYAPSSNPAIEEIMSNVKADHVKGFPDTPSLQKYVASNLGTVDFAVFFLQETLWQPSENTDLQPQQGDLINYVVYYNYSAFDANPDAHSSQYGVNVPLLTLQKQVEHGILKHRTKISSLVYDLDYSRIPSFSGNASWMTMKARPTHRSLAVNATASCGQAKTDFSHINLAVTWAFSFGLLGIGILAFQLVVEERTKGLFTSMRRLGMMDSTYWASWFFAFQIVILIGSTLAVTLAAMLAASDSKAPALSRVDLGIIFLIVWLGATCCVSNGFFLASVCSRPSLHTLAIFLNYVLMSITLLFNSVPLNFYSMATTTNSLTGVTSSNCVLVGSSFNAIYSDQLLFAPVVRMITFMMPWFHVSKAFLDIFSRIQYDGLSYTYHSLSTQAQQVLAYDVKNPAIYNAFGVRGDLVNMVYSSALYLFLAWALGLVMTGDAGEGRNWSALLPPRVAKFLFAPPPSALITDHQGDVWGQEQARSHQDGSVRVHKCSKTYSGVQALREVSFNVSRGECLVMLGHNGAGKSSLINILSGVNQPTHGKCFVAGIDVETDGHRVQNLIGICPQDDFLFDELTAREHMLLHASLKGVPDGPQLDSSVNHILARVKLLRRQDTLARNFSGGMKRRLSVAMAAIGDNSVIVLDEPSSGLDPLSRRYLWDMIQWLKRDRVMIITTHNMEEADYLGDSILMLHNGRVKAHGDPLFLKDRYGCGLSVRLNVAEPRAKEAMEMTRVILPHAWAVGDWTGGQINIMVPRQDGGFLGSYFKWIEGGNGNDEGSIVREWNIANPSLEDVFIQVCAQNNEVNFSSASSSNNSNATAAEFNLCPLCRLRVREPVVFRSVDGNNRLIVLPDALCQQCTRNEAFFLRDEDWAQITAPSPSLSEPASALIDQGSAWQLQQHRQNRLREYLQRCYAQQQQQQQQQHIAPVALQVESAAINVTATNVGTLNPLVAQMMPTLQQQQQQQHHAQIPAAPANSTWASQTKAIIFKNVTLQRHQRCSNICILVFVGFMLLVLVFFEFLFRFRGVQPCPSGGWVSASDCSMDLLMDHIFSANLSPLPGIKLNTQLGNPRGKKHRQGQGQGQGGQKPQQNNDDASTGGDDASNDGGASSSGGIDDGVDSEFTEFTEEGAYSPWSLRVLHYLIPGSAFNPLSQKGPVLNGAQKDEATGYYSGATFGLPVYINRFPIVWSSLCESGSESGKAGLSNTKNNHTSIDLLESELLSLEGGNGLAILMKPMPESAIAQTADEFLLSSQKKTYAELVNFAGHQNVYGGCRQYSPSLLVVNATLASLGPGGYQQYLPDFSGQNQFAQKFADAVFECPDCSTPSSSSEAASSSDSKAFFRGTMHVSESSLGTSYYPNALLNLPTGETLHGSAYGTDETAKEGDDDSKKPSDNFHMGFGCPPSVVLLTLGAAAGVDEGKTSPVTDQTFNAMTYLNMLSNSIADPTLSEIAVQGGVSIFGLLFFNFLILSEFISTFLTIFVCLIMNSVWPLSVWRISYERTSGIASMLKSIGLRVTSYYIGMYAIDTAVQTCVSLFAIGVAKYLNLSVFKDAPPLELCLTALLSAHAISALGLLLVRIMPSDSRLTSALSASISIFATVFSVLYGIFYGRDEGQWPQIFNLIPFFAQSRAVFLLLAYHSALGASGEVLKCWTALFFVGAACLVLCIAIELDPYDAITKMRGLVHKLLVWTQWDRWGSYSSLRRGGSQMDASIRETERGIVYMDVSLRGKQTRENSRWLDKSSSKQTAGGGGGASSGRRLNPDPAAVSVAGGGRTGSDGDIELSSQSKGWRSAHSMDSSSSMGSPASQSAGLLKYEPNDPDVTREKEAALSYNPTSPTEAGRFAIVLQKVSHTYTPLGSDTQQSTLALREVSLALPFGEVFGLLGPNGSGKSTTIGLLTGLITLGSQAAECGKIYIAGRDIRLHPDELHRLIGVCPQHDVVWDELTVQEHLEFQCAQRGIAENRIFGEAQRAALAVGLDGDGFRTPAGLLSGGMRRRLSLGMTLIGDPPILFLDEACAGLDPDNRQKIWQVIQSLRRPDRLILLTTHSMAEAETLCSRIGILAHGLLQCVGTPLALKFRFQSSYTLTMNLQTVGSNGAGGGGTASNSSFPFPGLGLGANAFSTSASAVDEWVLSAIGDGEGELVSTVNATRRYSIPRSAGSMAKIFDVMEACKASGRVGTSGLSIREWGIGLTTLEDVFISAVEAAEEGVRSEEEEEELE